MIKNPPYDVVFSDDSQVIPPYVSSIDNQVIKLGGCPLQRKTLGFDNEIILKDDNTREQNLLTIMLKLNSLGFAFAYDYKAYLSPSDYMKQLLCSGKLTTPFKEICWQNQGLWLLTTYEYEKNT